jgi:hypothetical protein
VAADLARQARAVRGEVEVLLADDPQARPGDARGEQVERRAGGDQRALPVAQGADELDVRQQAAPRVGVVVGMDEHARHAREQPAAPALIDDLPHRDVRGHVEEREAAAADERDELDAVVAGEALGEVDRGLDRPAHPVGVQQQDAHARLGLEVPAAPHDRQQQRHRQPVQQARDRAVAAPAARLGLPRPVRRAHAPARRLGVADAHRQPGARGEERLRAADVGEGDGDVLAADAVAQAGDATAARTQVPGAVAQRPQVDAAVAAAYVRAVRAPSGVDAAGRVEHEQHVGPVEGDPGHLHVRLGRASDLFPAPRGALGGHAESVLA